MSKSGTEIFATVFYVGYFPVAPGTLASLLGAGIYLLLGNHLTWYALVALLICIPGFGVGDRMEKIVGKKDPSCVVIDEVAGSLVAFFLLPRAIPVLVTAFFLFRAFDMFKVYPMDRLEDAGGGLGIMMDDIVAGIYTNVVMQIALRLAAG